MTTSNAKLQKVQRLESIGYGLLALGSLIYLGLTLLTPFPAGSYTYGLSVLNLHLLQLSLALPLIAIWFIALWGTMQFKRYSAKIEDSADGKALGLVANGLIILVTTLALSTILQSARPLLLEHGHVKAWVIFYGYVGIIGSLLAFSIFYQGSRRLASLVKDKGLSRGRLISLGALLVLGIAYGWLMALNPNRFSSSNPARYTSLYLPDWLILLTVMLPYLVIWYLGMVSVVCLRAYQEYSPGIIYRKSLSRLSSGMLWIIITSIAIQLLTAVGPALVSLGLKSLLVVIYALIILYAMGHVLVASGARKLSQIEEVR